MRGGGPGRCATSTRIPANTRAMRQQTRDNRRDRCAATIARPASSARVTVVSIGPKTTPRERRMPEATAINGATRGSLITGKHLVACSQVDSQEIDLMQERNDLGVKIRFNR